MTIQDLLDRTQLPQGRLRIFYRSVLHTLLLLCQESFQTQRAPLLQPIPWAAVWQNLRQRALSGPVRAALCSALGGSHDHQLYSELSLGIRTHLLVPAARLFAASAQL